MTIEDLAGMVQRGFLTVDEKFNQFNNKLIYAVMSDYHKASESFVNK